ncbi:MAG: MMPL family transporter, partial [Rubrobacter sp.]|nr:MMPL family transporter [Rubrobacter sp.]
MRIFHRLGEFTYRYRVAVVLAWAVLVVVSAFLAPNLGSRLKGGGFEGANSEAERVQDLMSDEFGVSPATLTIVFDGDGLPAKGDEFQRRESAALQGLQDMRETEQVTAYSDSEDPRFISEDGKKSYALVSFNVSSEETEDLVAEVRNHVRSGSMKTYVTGAPAVYQDITEASNQDIKRAEKYA